MLVQLFGNDKRAELKVANPDASFGDLTKLLAAAWKDASEEEKQKYQALAKVCIRCNAAANILHVMHSL